MKTDANSKFKKWLEADCVEKTERKPNIDHPFYCVWCGEVQGNQKQFKEHYEKCRDDNATISDYPGWSDPQ